MKREKNNPILHEAKAEGRNAHNPASGNHAFEKVTINLKSLDLVSYDLMRVETTCFYIKNSSNMNCFLFTSTSVVFERIIISFRLLKQPSLHSPPTSSSNSINSTPPTHSPSNPPLIILLPLGHPQKQKTIPLQRRGNLYNYL